MESSEAGDVDEGSARGTGGRVVWVGTSEAVEPERVDDALRDGSVSAVGSLSAAGRRLASERVTGVVVAGVTDPDEALRAVRERAPQVPVVLLVEEGGTATRIGGGTLDVNATLLVAGAETDRASLADAVADAIGAGEQPHKSIRNVPPGEELRLKERAMDEAPVGITISDPDLPDNPLVYVNEAFETMTGYGAGEALGVNCRFLQGPDTDDAAVAEIREAIAAEEPVTTELRNYRKDGERFWNRLHICPLTDGDEVTHYVGFQTDVTERKRMELALREERERLDRLVGRLRGLVADTTELLTAADSRTEIQRNVATRFGTDREYALAWVGEYDTTTETVTPVDVGGATVGESSAAFDLTDGTPATDALGRALESGDPVGVDSAGPLALAAVDDAAAVVVPLRYREAVYGVLVVLRTGEDAFEEWEREVLAALGRSIGSAINAVGSKRLIATDTVVEVSVDLDDVDAFPFRVSARTDCELAYETSRYAPDGEFVALFTVTAGEVDDVVAAATDDDRVTDAWTLAETDDGAVVQFRLPDAPLVRLLSEYGAHLVDVTAADGGGRLSFEVSDETSARALVERLEAEYGADLAAYREGRHDSQTTEEFRSAVEQRLTERQLTALRRAYASGFFDWPRDADGERLAESMDVVPSTFHQHLRGAQRKVFAELFD